MSELADAIHAWEAAWADTNGARKALDEAFDVLGATGSRDATIAWDACRRKVFDAKAREEEAERAALRLMPRGVPDGAEMPVDGSSGCVVGDRFYYQFDGEIHWMKVANG